MNTSDIECTETGCIFLIDNYKYTDEQLEDTEQPVLCDFHIRETLVEKQADLALAQTKEE